MKELKAVERIAKLNADNFALLSKVRTKDIIAIAGAFRALEKRTEENQEVIEEYNAAMCASNEAGYAGVTAAQTIRHLMQRAEAAEVENAGAEERCRMIFDAKNHWAERARAAEAKLAGLEKQELIIPEGLNRYTAELVLDFAKAIAEKLHQSELKYGWSDGWKESDWQDKCLTDFHHHISKGDPRDVAAYCAFMWHHEWPTRPAPAINLAELVPQPFDVFKQAGGVMVAVREGKTKNHLFGKGYNACIAYVINSIINSGELTRPDCESDEARLCEILRNIEDAK